MGSGEEMLTLEQLQEWGACQEGIEMFRDPNNYSKNQLFGLAVKGRDPKRPMRGVVEWLHSHRDELAPGPPWDSEEIEAGHPTYRGWLKFLRKRGGIDVDKYLPQPAPKEEPEVFEPEKLEVGDVVSSRKVTMHFINISAGAGKFAFSEDRVTGVFSNAVVFSAGSRNYAAKAVETPDLRTHITKVTRNDEVIFPLPKAVFVVGEHVDYWGAGIEVWEDPGYQDSPVIEINMSRRDPYRVEWRNGIGAWYRDGEIRKRQPTSVPCPFKVGDGLRSRNESEQEGRDMGRSVQDTRWQDKEWEVFVQYPFGQPCWQRASIFKLLPAPAPCPHCAGTGHKKGGSDEAR